MKLDDVMKFHHFVDILTGIHVCILLCCPLSIWDKESPSQISSSNYLVKGRCHNFQKNSLGQDPLGQLSRRTQCNFMKFLYKAVESRL